MFVVAAAAVLVLVALDLLDVVNRPRVARPHLLEPGDRSRYLAR
jgi:hypothetical protein